MGYDYSGRSSVTPFKAAWSTVTSVTGLICTAATHIGTVVTTVCAAAFEEGEPGRRQGSWCTYAVRQRGIPWLVKLHVIQPVNGIVGMERLDAFDPLVRREQGLVRVV